MRKLISHFLCFILLVCGLSLSACHIINGADDNDNDNDGGGNSYSNVSVKVTSATMRKTGSGASSWRHISYTVKAYGINASDVSKIGCSASIGGWNSSASGTTSYSHSDRTSLTRSSCTLRPYVIPKGGSKITGPSKFVKCK